MSTTITTTEGVRRRGIAVVLVASTLLFAACGSGSDDGEGQVLSAGAERSDDVADDTGDDGDSEPEVRSEPVSSRPEPAASTERDEEAPAAPSTTEPAPTTAPTTTEPPAPVYTHDDFVADWTAKVASLPGHELFAGIWAEAGPPEQADDGRTRRRVFVGGDLAVTVTTLSKPDGSLDEVVVGVMSQLSTQGLTPEQVFDVGTGVVRAVLWTFDPDPDEVTIVPEAEQVIGEAVSQPVVRDGLEITAQAGGGNYFMSLRVLD